MSTTIQQQGADFKITVERVDRSIPDPDEEPTISVKRYAATMGVSLRTAYLAITNGEIPYIQKALQHESKTPKLPEQELNRAWGRQLACDLLTQVT